MTFSGLFTKIFLDIVNDRVNLPSLPDIAIRLRKALANEDYTIDVLARIIQTDASVSAYLLNVANSSLYRTRAKATDIPSAIRIMGVSAVRNLVTAYSLRSIAVFKKIAIKKQLDRHWKKSAYQAAIAHAVAKLIKSVDPERALLAGLLQAVGALPVLMKLDESRLDSPSDQQIEAALDIYSGKVGVLLAQKWELDDELVAVIKNGGNLAYDGGAEIDLVDVVNIARLLSQIGSGKINWPRLEDSPCLQKFSDDGLTLPASMRLLKEAQEDINELKSILAR